MFLILIQKMRICIHMSSSESRVRKQHLSSNIRKRLRTGTAIREAIYIEGRFVRPGAPALKTNQYQNEKLQVILAFLSCFIHACFGLSPQKKN